MCAWYTFRLNKYLACGGTNYSADMNPAPGVCLPVIVKFCETAPYNYTVFPNYIGHFGQLDAEEVCGMHRGGMMSTCVCVCFGFPCKRGGRASGDAH